jgi:hypothetical protein
MNRTKLDRSIPNPKQTFPLFLVSYLLLLQFLSACSPAAVPASSTLMVDTPAQIPEISTEVLATPTLQPSPTSTLEADTVFPYYLPLTFKPDVEPQTINGVTTTIDWAYADEGRVAIHYTISGLDWPKGTSMDPTLMAQMTSETVPNIWMGGMGWSQSPVEQGVITGEYDQRLVYGALDQQKNPNIRVNVDIPVEGPAKIGTFQFKLDLPVLPGKVIENINQTVVANKVSMTLKDLRLTPSYAEASVCFQMPSAVDWGLTASTVTIGGREYPFSGGGLMHGTKKQDFALTDPERCSTIGFDVAADSAAGSLTLTVPRLVASTPEVISQERVDLANQMLADEGIEFKYFVLDHGSNIEIVKRPAGKTDEEIYPKIWNALADQYEGPWVFAVPLP